MLSRPTTSPENLDDVLARAKAGDREALETILANVAPSIHRFGLRMCRNVHDAEDVLQDTLIAIAEHLQDFAGRSSLSSWVFSLTRSACARKRRGLKNRPPESDEHVRRAPDDAPTPETRVANDELATALSQALDHLSDDYREVLILRDIEGLSAAEAASSLEITVDALKSRLHRAREALRTAMRPFLESTSIASHPTCPDVALLWSKKLEGDLSQGDCAAMERHVAGCETCASACDALKRALFACRSARTEHVPPEVQARVKDAVRVFLARRTA